MKAWTIWLCCAAVVAGLGIFDFGCSMWFHPLGIVLAGLEIATIGLLIGRSLTGEDKKR